MNNYIIPITVIFVILYGIIKKTDIYSSFVEGAKESFNLIFNLFPTLLFMLIGINIFINSQILDHLSINILNLPNEVITLMITRPISGSSSLAILNSIFEIYGPDSFIGILTSVMQGSTDTTIYILTLYFGTVGIKKMRYALWVGLLSDISAFIISYFVVRLFL